MSVGTTPSHHPLDPLEDLFRRCTSAVERKDQRTFLGKEAHVGTATYNGIKKRGAEGFRKKLAVGTPKILTSLLKICLAAGEDPAEWIRLINESGCRKYPYSEKDVARLVKDARDQMNKPEPKPQLGPGPNGCTMDWIKAALGNDENAELKVRVCLLTCARPFSVGKRRLEPHDTAQRTFYRKFVELVLGAIDPRLKPEIIDAVGVHGHSSGEPGTFKEVMEGLNTSPRRYPLLVGPWSMVARSTFNVTFTKIPCLWHRISCLTRARAAQSATSLWEQVLGGALLRQGELGVVTMAGEAADVYLRSYRAYGENQLIRVRTYDTEKYARTLAETEAAHRHATVVGVIGEFEARNVTWYWTNGTWGRGGEKSLEDVAARKDANAPRYPLAAATHVEDRLWTETVRLAIEEMFVNAPALIAEVYGDYLADVLVETFQLEGGDATRFIKRQFFDPEHEVPGYLQLGPPEGLGVSPTFRRHLEKYLTPKLEGFLNENGVRPSELSEKFKPSDLFDRMVPWQHTEREKSDEVLNVVRALQKNVEALMKQFGGGGAAAASE